MPADSEHPEAGPTLHATHRRTLSTWSSKGDWASGELEVWREALEAFDQGQHGTAKAAFRGVEQRAKVKYNMAMCAILVDDLEEAERLLRETLQQDPFLAIAAYQMGCLLVEKECLKEALGSFDLCLNVPTLSRPTGLNMG